MGNLNKIKLNNVVYNLSDAVAQSRLDNLEIGETVDLSAYSEGDTVPTEKALKLANPLNTAKYTDDYYRIVTDTTVEGTRMILFAALNSANGGGGFYVALPAGTSDWKFSGAIEIAILGYDANNILKIKINNADKCFKLIEGDSNLSYTEIRKNTSQSGDIVLNLPASGGTLALTSDITAPTYQQIITALGYTPMDSALKGANNGVAELGADGKVPTSQLPSYVDDVIEGYYYNGKFYEDASHTVEITPESGKIYVDLTTNKTYRWSGSAYVEISASLVLGETSTTAYRGDRGKAAYDHSELTSGNPHNVTKSDLGLDNVENKSSSDIRGEITSQNVQTALGYTPYNATNPNRYISGISGSDVTTALGYTPYDSANPSGYLSSITGQQVRVALGYTPYDNDNPNGYISGINSSDVTTALGYVPYNSTNPSNYIDATTTSLNNYYKKTEVDGMVANRFQALIVQTLPTSGISTSTIYMVLQTGQTDIYDEWMYISNAWTKIGTTSIDMSDYAKKDELHNVALTGAYSSLVGKPTIPEDTADLTNSAGYVTKAVNNLDNYTQTSSLANVALTGSYTDLTNTPTIPSALGTLTNDVGYIKQSDLATTNISSLYNDVPYATLNQIQGLQDIDVEEIKKAIAAMEHIGTVTQVTAGTGLTGGGNTSVTINHANSVTAKSGYPTGTTLVNGGSFTVRDAQYDAQGHITGTQDRVITMEEIPAYNDTAVRGLIQNNTDDITALDARVTAQETMFKDTFTSFVFCIFGIEPYIDPSTMQLVPNRYYQRSDVDTGIFMDNHKIDIHLKAWLKYHYNIDSLDYLKNITCYVYAMGDHGTYVNHMVTFWSQSTNPDITSYPHLQQVGSFMDDGYGSVRRFSPTEVGAILSSTDDGYIQADPLGTGKGFVSGWNTLTGRVTDVEMNKQAKLTAGTNITIDENNVISASGGGGSIVQPLYTYTGTFDSAHQSLNTNIALIANTTYIFKFENTITEGAIKTYISGATDHFTRVFSGNRMVCFRPKVSGMLELYNTETTSTGNTYLGGVTLKIYAFTEDNAHELDMPTEYVVDKDYSAETNYNSFTQCIMDLLDDERNKTIYLHGGDYNIFEEYHTFGMPVYTGTNWTEDYPNYCAHIPTNAHIIGQGVVKIIWMPDPTTTTLTLKESWTVAPINVFGSCILENFEIYCKNGRYCIHDDPLGDIRYTGATKIYKGLKCYRYTNDTDPTSGDEYGFNYTIGFGMDSSMHFEFIDCLLQNFETNVGSFYMHDRCLLNKKQQLVPTNESSDILVKNCIILTNNNSASAPDMYAVELYNERPMYNTVTGEIVDAKWSGEAYNNKDMPIRHCRVYFESTYIDGKVALFGTKGGGVNTCYNGYDLTFVNCNNVEVYYDDVQHNQYPPKFYNTDEQVIKVDTAQTELNLVAAPNFKYVYNTIETLNLTFAPGVPGAQTSINFVTGFIPTIVNITGDNIATNKVFSEIDPYSEVSLKAKWVNDKWAIECTQERLYKLNSDYQELKYIEGVTQTVGETTTGSYIDLGFNPIDNYQIYMRYTIGDSVGQGGFIFGCYRQDASGENVYENCALYASKRLLENGKENYTTSFYTGNSGFKSSGGYCHEYHDEQYMNIYILSTGRLYIGDTYNTYNNFKHSSVTQTTAVPVSLVINGVKDNINGVSEGFCKERILRFSYKDTTRELYLIPVINKCNNKVGLYDLINSTFYSTADGILTFKAGPAIDEANGEIAFNSAYDHISNKVATMQDITDVVGQINTLLDNINGEVI